MKLLRYLSMRYLGIILLLISMVCGIATFVEHYYSTNVAKSVIYDTHWFELIFAIGAASLVYNIIVFKLYKRKKIAIGLFHFAFVLMILGAGITRYFGQDGQIHLREGDETSLFLSRNNGNIKRVDLPFSISLNKFNIEYYPGSKTPSEYRSLVSIKEDRTIIKQEEVYMNHIVKYKGYRFFQSSYDQDMKGSILSVNHDPIGMMVSYTGYGLMFLGMFLSLFSKRSRFQQLSKQLNQGISILALLLCLGYSQASEAKSVSDKTVTAFSEMWVSNSKGRIIPMNTLNSQLIQKLVHERNYDNQSADKLLLNILVYPNVWKQEPIIYIENEAITDRLHLSGNYASYEQFFKQDRYILLPDLEKAYAKPVDQQNKYDKKVIAITERVSIFKMIVEGTFLNIFPMSDTPHESWLNPHTVTLDEQNMSTVNYTLKAAIQSQSNVELQKAFKSIANYQQTVASHVLPSAKKRDVEILYNKLNIFTRLAPTYATLAILLLIICIVDITKNTRSHRLINGIFFIIIAVFSLHTLAIAMRWYISGHAPMSNGYESMLVVSWATILGGLCLAQKSSITLAISTIMAGSTLLVAHINSMNPEITALVPVLNSNWLSIHVATITASYGFLSICALIGLFNIITLAFSRTSRLAATIKELTTVSQLLMIIGIYLLTIGCFIGAIWANESWGRYWSWDPKETWCLITIFVYAIVIHMHHVPKLSGLLAYNTAAFWSILTVLMTYFGVNYFLGGMHSYGKGEANELSIWYFIFAAILLIINTKALLREKR